MKFNTLYVSKWADGDPGCVRVIETPTYSLHSMVAGDSCDRIGVVADYCTSNNIHSLVLCPGFTHSMAAGLAEKLNGRTAVAVARTDGPGSSITGPVKNEARKGLCNE